MHACFRVSQQRVKPLCSMQNFALNVAEKGFDIAVFNRSYDKTEACVRRAEKEGIENLP